MGEINIIFRILKYGASSTIISIKVHNDVVFQITKVFTSLSQYQSLVKDGLRQRLHLVIKHMF